jgi:adenosylhomocysteinase
LREEEPAPIGDLEPDLVAEADAADGARRVAWARANMPVLDSVRAEFTRQRPLEGRRVGMCLHVRRKTAVLVEVLRAGGAEVAITGSPATTDDCVAAFLALDPGVRVYARRTDGREEHHRHVVRVLAAEPDVLVDNGADLIAATVARGSSRVIAATEETTSGAARLRENLAGEVQFPVVVINDSPLKSLLENQYGVGPTVVEGFMRATNRLVATTTFVVVGYGSCGRGIARALRALGGSVTVVERNVARALEAAFDGMRVRDLPRALPDADVVITATGRERILLRDEILLLRDGAVLANTGHFGNEIDVAELERLATATRELDDHITEYELQGGRCVRLLARGEMLNLTAAAGNPIEVMDLGYAIQARVVAALSLAPEAFAPGPQPVPDEINRSVGIAFLRTLSVVELGPDAGFD